MRGAPMRIEDGNRRWWFTFSERWGPLCVSENGFEVVQPGPSSVFWRMVSLWNRQGARVDDGLAVWCEPPTATYTFIKRGRSREIIHCDEPEGYDPEFSPEIFVEQPA